MDSYEIQRNANILAFLTAPEYQEQKRILKKVSEVLMDAKVRWALSCSSALFFKGLVDDFHDYDILVNIEDVEIMINSLESINVTINKDTIQKEYFTSPYYQQAKRGNCDFDLIGDITINTFGGRYCYPVKNQELEYVFLEGNIVIPIIPVEASFLLYAMMEGWQSRRRFKKEICLSFLKEKGVIHKEILQDALKQKIPYNLQEVIKSLL